MITSGQRHAPKPSNKWKGWVAILMDFHDKGAVFPTKRYVLCRQEVFKTGRKPNGLLKEVPEGFYEVEPHIIDHPFAHYLTQKWWLESLGFEVMFFEQFKERFING